jgi:hypothetical protein
VRCLITSGLSKTPFSTAKNLNCLNLDTARMFRLNQMSKLEFVYKMNAIQNKNATKLILNQIASMLALLNLPFAISIDTSSAFSLSPFFRFSMALNAICH